ncbi:hypothetical protein HI914_05750 [Erysiphe necator]|uniref:Putative s-adenosyl-l-methionine-dependent methyltransferase n=1 Tax=Uncinula necator TaxID=52586 RepID=A0A0B1P5V6_UNCNE|nr:hypothetical protein HI914_05750 [Erysiphe necator]KHJ32064.1 putative s-adenosyl-l-methionine-dependent methyltransferase [Erysiphe necator]
MDEKITPDIVFGKHTPAIEADKSLNDVNEKNSKVKTSSYREIIANFLLLKDSDFMRLSEFRHRGWITNKEIADAHFIAQRNKADFADAKTRTIFFKMMIQIAEEMHLASNIFCAERRENEDIKILDICMAPGGYTAAVLKSLPNAKCFCLTLPPEEGGHDILVDVLKIKKIILIDITLLIKEFSNNKVPDNYPLKSKFSNRQPFKCHKFDLVFCDGMVLRTHIRPGWREQTEATRLLLSQLILAMQRLRSGGTLVILLHKVENWDSILTIRSFSRFSNIQLFKPVKKHNTRSSFYMIAKDIDIHCEAAQKALLDWRLAWWQATFGGEHGLGEKLDPDEDTVLRVLEEFGDYLIRIAKPIWKIQADALSMTDYAGCR